MSLLLSGLIGAFLTGAQAAPLSPECREIRQTEWTAPAAADRCAALPDLSPTDRADALALSGEIRRGMGDTEGAERALRASLAAKKNPEVALEIAELMRDRPAEALEFAQEAARELAGERLQVRALVLESEIRRDLDDVEGAKVGAALALVIAPDDIEALGLAASLRGDRASAASACRAAGSAPMWCRGSAFRKCAQIQLDLGRRNEAASALAGALAVDAMDVNALEMLLQIKRLDPELSLPAIHPPASGGAAAAGQPRDLEWLRARFAQGLAARKTAEARGYAGEFAASIKEAPPWQRDDAYWLCAQMWIELGDRRASDQCLAQLKSVKVSHTRNYVLRSGPAAGDRTHPLQLEEAEIVPELVRLRLELGDPAGARAALDWGLKLKPDNVPLFREMADLDLARNEPRGALVYARKMLAAAEKETPADALASFSSKVVLLPDAGNAAAPENLDDPEVLRRARQELHGYRMDALRRLVSILAALGRTKDAMSYAEREIASADRDNAAEQAEAWRDKARVQDLLRDAAGRRASLEKASSLAPKDSQSLRELLELSLSAGMTKEALSYAERELAAFSKPEDQAAAWRDKARVQERLKDDAGRRDSLAKALSLEPDDPWTVHAMLEVQLSLGVLKEALVSAERELALKGTPADLAAAWRDKARVQERLEDEAGRRESLERALALEPKDRRNLEQLMELSSAAGRDQEALSYAERAVAAARGSPADEAAAWRTEARIQERLKDDAGRRASLEKALSLDPQDAENLRDLMELSLSEGLAHEALSYAEREIAAAAKPDEKASAWRDKARVQRLLKDDAGRRASLERALSLEPDDCAALRDLIRLRLGLGVIKGAPVLADRALAACARLSPAEAAELWRDKARAQTQLGDAAGRRESLQNILALEPGDRGALRALLELQLASGVLKDAEASARRALAAAKTADAAERAAAWRDLARVQEALRDDAGRGLSLQEALALEPDDRGTLKKLLEVELAAGRPKEALAYAKRAAAAKGTYAELAGAWRDAARVQERLQDAAAQRASLERALVLEPSDFDSQWRLLDLERSESSRSSSVGASSGSAVGLSIRGMARALDGDRAAGRRDLEAAVKLDARSVCYGGPFWYHRDRLDPLFFDACVDRFPKDPALRQDRGVALFEAGRRDAALDDFRGALALKPDFAEASLSLASALQQAGRPAEALKVVDDAIAAARGRQGDVYAQILALQSSLREAELSK